MHAKTPKCARRASPLTTTTTTTSVAILEQASFRRSKSKSCLSDGIANEPIMIPRDHAGPPSGAYTRRSFSRDKEGKDMLDEISAESWDVGRQAKVWSTQHSEIATSCRPKDACNSRLSGNPLPSMADKKGSPKLKQPTVSRLSRTKKDIHLELDRGRRRNIQAVEIHSRPRVLIQPKPKESLKRRSSDQVFPLTSLESYLHERCFQSSLEDSQGLALAGSKPHDKDKSVARSRNRNCAAVHNHQGKHCIGKGGLSENERYRDDADDSETSRCGMPRHRSNNNHTREGPAIVSTGNCFRVSRRRVVRRGRVGYKCNSERSLSSFDSDSETAPLMTDPEPYHDLSDGFTSSSAHVDGEAGNNKRLSRFEHHCKRASRLRRDYVVSNRQVESQGTLVLRRQKKNAGANVHRSLSQKYRPNSFKDLIGQNMVVESLRNAILRGAIAPVYLFCGPRGTGKTSSAKIFTRAMNCLSIEELRPCGVCNQCTVHSEGQNYDVKEVDASTINNAESMNLLLKHISLPPSSSRYKVFIVDGCHALTSEAWKALLKAMEEPPSYAVFILITTDLEPLPRSAVSQCRRLMFPRIKDADIVFKLQTIAMQENVEIELEAVQFIASRSDGSFRDAENMLDQLSLLGIKVTLATVQEMVGLIPDGKLSKLLELALSGDTASTIKAIRELIESGVEPLALTTQLADMITDILAGKNRVPGYVIGRMKKEEEERLKQSLKILADSEKQLRACDYRITWLTAAFLQFSQNKPSARSPAIRVKASEKETVECDSVIARKTSWEGEERLEARPSPPQRPSFSLSVDEREGNPREKQHAVDNRVYPCTQSPPSSSPTFENVSGSFAQRRLSITSPSTMKNLWNDVVDGSCPNIVKQLLHKEGRLVSLSVNEAGAVARLEFRRPEHKNMAESVRTNIVNAFHRVLGLPLKLEIRLSLRPSETGFICREGDAFVQRKLGRHADQEHEQLEDTKRAIGGSVLVSSPSDEHIVSRLSFGIEEVDKRRSSVEYGQGGKMTIDLRQQSISVNNISRQADGVANDENSSSGSTESSDGDAPNNMCCTTLQRCNKGKRVRPRRRRRFLLGLVPSCSKAARKTKQAQNRK